MLTALNARPENEERNLHIDWIHPLSNLTHNKTHQSTCHASKQIIPIILEEQEDKIHQNKAKQQTAVADKISQKI